MQPTRIDWQYLIPLPATGKVNHLHYLHNSSQIPIESLQTIGDKVTIGASPTIPSDLLLIPHSQPFKQVSFTKYLNDKGIVLLEIQRTPLHFWDNHPHQVTTFLEKQGLSVLDTIWVAPNFDEPKRYLPLKSIPILRWYFQSLFISGSQITQIAKKLFSRTPQLLEHIVPSYIIIAVKSENPKNTQKNHPLIDLASNSPTVNPVIITSGFDSGSRTVLLPFTPEDREPSVILKVANTPTLNSYTLQEQQTLTKLSTILTPALKASIPQTLGITTYNEKTVSLETPAQGIPLWTLLQDISTKLQQKLEILHSASKWITEFHQATTKEHISIQVLLKEWLDPITRTYQHHFGENPTVKSLINKVKKHAENLKEISIPLVWQHFDYSPWNIYQDKHRITVIDWEYGRTTQTDTYGPPLCDLIYFIKYWLHAIQKTKTIRDELSAFHFILPEGKVKAECQKALTLYCRMLTIPTTLIPVLTMYTWMEQAVHLVERQALQENRAHIPNKAHLYIEVLATHQNILFPT